MKDLSQLNLFSKKFNLKIIKIGPSDVKLRTDNFQIFSNVVTQHESMYPNIRNWLKQKVFPGINSRERVAYLGFDNEKPIVSAVVKKGNSAKFCHLHIDDHYQNINIGDIFFSMMAIEIRNQASAVHFTLPESLWTKKKLFFESFGFKEVVKSKIQYRNFEEELMCSADFNTIWNNTLLKLPKIIDSCTNSNMNIFNGLLFSLKPKYVEKLMGGEKIVEIRKRFDPKWSGCKAFIYSTSPTKALYGHATIKDVDRGNPETIWEKYNTQLGCIKKEFDDYVGSADRIYAIQMNSFTTYLYPLYLEQLELLLRKNLQPPQSYLTLEKNKLWAEAISIAELLDGKFSIYCENKI